MSGAGKNYAGIGSRQTPADILELMEESAIKLARAGWQLRSGGAPGADQAFERGARQQHPPEIWIPWNGFEGRAGLLPMPEAYPIAAQYHPNWPRLSRGVRALMSRNVHQVLGADLASPVQMIICWTPDGSLDGRGNKSGGTGMALRLATDWPQIKVFNLCRPEHRERLSNWVRNPESDPAPVSTAGE